MKRPGKLIDVGRGHDEGVLLRAFPRFPNDLPIPNLADDFAIAYRDQLGLNLAPDEEVC